jgi:hypothetical protein
MSSQAAMSLMSVVEFALWTALGLLFWKKRLNRRFPAMGAYVALRVASAPLLLAFLFAGGLPASHRIYAAIYFLLYWAVYIACAVMLFFVCIEVFRSALSAFSGLQRLGTVAFRWTVLVSVLVSLSTLSFEHHDVLVIPAIAYRLMRSVSILELCLLAFLCLSMNALRLSVRDIVFGIALGLGVMSSSDFVVASFISSHTLLTGSLQFVIESMILVSIGIWATYCILPERVRQPILLPVNSILFRWDEIATALGHTGTQVAVQPAGGFRLTEAENAVEEALTQDMKSRA